MTPPDFSGNNKHVSSLLSPRDAFLVASFRWPEYNQTNNLMTLRSEESIINSIILMNADCMRLPREKRWSIERVLHVNSFSCFSIVFYTVYYQQYSSLNWFHSRSKTLSRVEHWFLLVSDVLNACSGNPNRLIGLFSRQRMIIHRWQICMIRRKQQRLDVLFSAEAKEKQQTSLWPGTLCSVRHSSDD